MKLLHKLLHILEKADSQLKRRLSMLLLILLIMNCGVWAATFFFSYKYPVLLGLVMLAYGLGLRHAVDADHIAAIDNTTRKLMQEGQQPIGVGFFFSLGHSTVVILLSILLAISASFVKTNLPSFEATGSLIGTSVSSIFLIFIGLINTVAFFDVLKLFKKITKEKHYVEKDIHDHMHITGFLARLFRPLMSTIAKSWHMYPLGFLFGLGFDTASEVALLSISAAAGANKVIPIGVILLLPISFTAGMALIDSLDSILMLGAYGWAYVKPLRKLYYNLNITFISVIVALFIGGIEGLQIIFEKLHISGGIADSINNLDFGNLGYIIIGIFIFSWIASIVFYKLKNYDLLDFSVHSHE